MTGDELRKAFLDFFQERGHLLVPSSSLIPAGDPTLLLTSAGMVQFKPYFTGEAEPPHPRLTSVQKCFRATDIDEVGDLHHLTFFEMLGNFSVGDYFKKGAIEYAWEFVTRALELPEERLWVTIYRDDDEAFQHWREIGVPATRISRWGEKENFWGPAGAEGPCGPCSEIHYDYGPEYSCSKATCGPNCECGRFVELWNLVFMQFYQAQDGTRTPLPSPNIDTGMGLERTAAVIQGKRTAYETDLFAPVIGRVEEMTGKEYETADEEKKSAIRIVAEHARSATFLIADGVVPGNEGRGYVLRRVIRRAIRFGRKLGLEGPLLGGVAQAVVEGMGHQYRELQEKQPFILKTLELEEEQFAQTFQRGNGILKGMIASRSKYRDDIPQVLSIMESNPENPPDALQPLITFRGLVKDESEGAGYDLAFNTLTKLRTEKPDEDRAEAWLSQLTGEEAFILYDTYGFPPELTQEIAREHGLEVDMEGFEKEMEAQRERGRAAHRFLGEPDQAKLYESLGVGTIRFLGYETTEAQGGVVALIKEGVSVDQVSRGDEVEVVLRETPFYAEGGGQVGDAGVLQGAKGSMRVKDTQAPVLDLIIHRGRVEKGTLGVGEKVHAQVDTQRREDIVRNHSATHLLHAALRQVLGVHVRQSGSLVAPDRLRFDFTHVSSLSREELFQVQCLVNERIRQNLAVRSQETTFREAVAQGALAFFGDRYGHEVRVVEMGDGDVFSQEMCGGIHVPHTGAIGYLHILSEGSIGAGVRRIEAVTGRGAEELLWQRMGTLDALARRLQTSPGELERRADALLEELERSRKQASSVQRESSLKQAEELLAKAQQVDGVTVLTARASASHVEGLRQMGDWLRDKLRSGIIVLGEVLDDRPTLVAMVTPDLVAKGFHAGEIVSEVAKTVEGRGGGRPEVAQAGGKRKEKLEEALAQVVELVRRKGASL